MRLTDRLRLTDKLTDRLTDRLADRLTDSLTDRLTDGLTDRLNDGLTDRPTTASRVALDEPKDRGPPVHRDPGTRADRGSLFRV